MIGITQSGIMKPGSSGNLGVPTKSFTNGTSVKQPMTSVSYVASDNTLMTEARSLLMNEVARRQAAEARVRELEDVVDRLSTKIALLEEIHGDKLYENLTEDRDPPAPKSPGSSKVQPQRKMDYRESGGFA